MISELNIGDIVLPLEDGREIRTTILPYKPVWDVEQKGYDLIYNLTNETRHATPKEMLCLLKCARQKIDRVLDRLNDE